MALDGEIEVEKGARLPGIPRHNAKFIGRFGNARASVQGALNVTSSQFLRGDEANVTTPLDGYFVADARVGWEWNGWEIAGIVTNLFNKKYASFGTFNINQGGGDVLERFLTPGQVRQFRVVVTREFGVDRD